MITIMTKITNKIELRSNDKHNYEDDGAIDNTEEDHDIYNNWKVISI